MQCQEVDTFALEEMMHDYAVGVGVGECELQVCYNASALLADPLLL